MATEKAGPKPAAEVVAKARRWWPVDQERLDEEMGRYYELFAKDQPTEALVDVETEHKGGKCLLCGRDYKPVKVFHAQMLFDKATGKSKVGQVFADFTMFAPDCRCYKTCREAGRMGSYYTRSGKEERMVRVPGCGRVMVTERLLSAHGNEQKTCLNCGGIIL